MSDTQELSWYEVITGKGGHCPCCQRWGKANGYLINSTMAKALHWLCTTNKRDALGWVNIRQDAPRWVLRGGVMTTMKHWGLVAMPVDGTSGLPMHNTGLLKATPRALGFVFNGESVPKRVYVYNDQRLKSSDEMITFKDALASPFDYEEIMEHRMDGNYDYSFWRE